MRNLFVSTRGAIKRRLIKRLNEIVENPLRHEHGQSRADMLRQAAHEQYNEENQVAKERHELTAMAVATAMLVSFLAPLDMVAEFGGKWDNFKVANGWLTHHRINVDALRQTFEKAHPVLMHMINAGVLAGAPGDHLSLGSAAMKAGLACLAATVPLLATSGAYLHPYGKPDPHRNKLQKTIDDIENELTLKKHEEWQPLVKKIFAQQRGEKRTKEIAMALRLIKPEEAKEFQNYLSVEIRKRGHSNPAMTPSPT